MRNLRMSMPQYITNVTSFNDAIRILKNKAILTESAGDPLISQMPKEDMIKFLGMTAEEAEGKTDEELRDAVKEKNSNLEEDYDGPSEPRGNEALGDYYDAVGEELEDIAKEKYDLDADEMDQMFENEWFSNKNDKAIEKAFKEGIEPSVMAARIIESYINMRDDVFDDMIKKSEDELGPDKYKFNDFEGGLSEAENTNLRDPQAVAKLVADKHGAKLKPLYNEYKAAFEQYIQNIKDKELSNAYNVLVKKFQNSAINLAGDEMLEAGMEKTAVSNLLSGYGYFEDWIQDYISDLGDILKREDLNENEETDQERDTRRKKTSKDLDQALLTFLTKIQSQSPTPEIAQRIKDQEAKMKKDYGSLEEGKKKKESKKELHPNQIHPQELRMGIKVELEHTDDLDKAKKIALDHLAENPFYYTALKLAGVESPSAPKAKTPVEKKTKKKKEAVELVDKTNAMQKVKLKEVKLNISGEPNAVVKQVEEFIKKADNPILDTLESKEGFELQQTQDPNEAILRYGYWKELPKEAVDVFQNEFKVEVDRDNDEDTGEIVIYRLTPKSPISEKYSPLIPALEKLVREAIAEYYDGRDNLAKITDDTKEYE
jgi:hypothetical protein